MTYTVETRPETTMTQRIEDNKEDPEKIVVKPVR
jgi:hypothetical protein